MGKVISGKREASILDLQKRAAQAASGLDSLGISEADAIALLVRNDFVFFEAAIGAAMIGSYAVPINWHSIGDEVQYILEDSDAKSLIIHADLWDSLQADLSLNIPVFVVPTGPDIAERYGIDPGICAVPQDQENWNLWIEGFSPWTEPPRPRRSNVIYTSGTTGKPKGVVREPETPELTAAFAEMMNLILGMEEGQAIRTVITGPIYHGAPNAYALRSFMLGGYTVLQPKFDPEELLALIEEHQITHLHMVPVMFLRLLELSEDKKSKYDLSSLKCVAHAAAPCPPEVKRRMIEWWGPIINEYYGGTESGPVVYHTSEEALRKPGTVGRAMPHVALKVLDEDGEECQPGVPGEVFMLNTKYSDFTYKNKVDTKKEIERDGLMCLGDVGYLDDDGYLFLCDRSRDIIISGGVNIYPAEIEGALLNMAGVKDCAVFGIPDDEFGESVCTHVDVDATQISDEDQIREYLAQKISKFKVPKRIVFDSDIPREDSGKVMKRKIRDRYWEGTGRRI